MAWVAKIDSLSSDLINGNLIASISYYDSTDTQFQTVLWAYVFTFPVTMALADMRNQVIKTGQSVRASKAMYDNLIANIPTGTTINVQ